jgi:hypothetical protein
MDVLYFLRDRLDFIRSLYDDSTASFVEIKRKIESNEEPYVYEFDPDYESGEPPFLAEWQHADDCIVSLGRWCVLLLSTALKGYLHEFSRDMSSYYGHYFPEFMGYEQSLKSHQKGKGWLKGNQSFFLETYKIDWSYGPALVDSLEHLVLTRNDLEHNTDLITRYVSQTTSHRDKQAEGIFTDKESCFWDENAQLAVDKNRLYLAIETVGEFCAWLESIRTDYLRFRRAATYEQFLAESTRHTSSQ